MTDTATAPTAVLSAPMADHDTGTPTRDTLGILAEVERIAMRRKARAEEDDLDLARAIDQVRLEGRTWQEISEAAGGSGRQYADNLRKRLPDPE